MEAKKNPIFSLFLVFFFSLLCFLYVWGRIGREEEERRSSPTEKVEDYPKGVFEREQEKKPIQL